MADHDAAINYALEHAGAAAHLGNEDDEINKAIVNTVQWARIAVDQLVEHGIPIVHAAGLIVNVVNINLNLKILEPLPEQGEGGA
jgi:hypothetical protein